MQTTTRTGEMRERWRETGEEWLRKHPVMEPPAGFVLDPTMVGPARADERSGWCLLGEEEGQPDDVMLYAFANFAPATQAFVAAHVERDPRVTRIELWEGDCCIWAAVRSA